jgi:hypothetical protein
MTFETRGAGGWRNIEERTLDGADVLHAACGIYTRPTIVDMILDNIGWCSDYDLIDNRLLEPASGDGAFVLTAVDRLLRSFAAHGHAPRPDLLAERLLAFEIHAGEAAKCRAAVTELLINHGLMRNDAQGLATNWVRKADFLLSPLTSGSFTHVVGNPPYLRWSKLPVSLRSRYEQVLPPTAAKGDLFLPFLDRGIEALKVGGKLGFVCTDRWKFMGFAEGFRRSRLPEVNILQDRAVTPAQAYVEAASTYPSIVVMQRRGAVRKPVPKTKIGVTLKEAGFEVRVGPALGCTDAYVLPLERAHEVEEELLRPWLSPSDVGDGWIEKISKVVICLYDDDGKLQDIDRFPKAKAWMTRYRAVLEQRAVVRKQRAAWYRPIDKVSAKLWMQPKLLVPELSKNPRLALDTSGAVPAHGLYAIQARECSTDLHKLAAKLADGHFAKEIAKLAPRANGGYLRCYKRFIESLLIE